MNIPMSIQQSVSSSKPQSFGEAFESEVYFGNDNSGVINNHMNAVRANSSMQREVASVMPRYFSGKDTGSIDIVAISNDGKTVEIIEVKNWNKKNDGMTPSEAAFDQAIGGAVAIQSGNGRHPVKGFRNFETYIITSIARYRGHDSVRSESFSADEVAKMGRVY